MRGLIHSEESLQHGNDCIPIVLANVVQINVTTRAIVVLRVVALCRNVVVCVRFCDPMVSHHGFAVLFDQTNCPCGCGAHGVGKESSKGADYGGDGEGEICVPGWCPVEWEAGHGNMTFSASQCVQQLYMT